MRDKKDANHVDVQLYLEDFEKLQFKLEYLDAKTLNSENVHHNAKLLNEAPTIFGAFSEVNQFKECGNLFVAHALLVLGESEAQAEINALQKELDNLIMEKYKRADEAKIKDLNLLIEKLTIEVSDCQRALNTEITETQAKQIELDKNAEEFKRHHDERHKLFLQW